MTEGSGTDWQVGDLALCVEDDWKPSPISGSRVQCGNVLTVSALHRGDGDELYLIFPEFPNEGWEAQSFRKIRPSAVSEIEKLRALCDAPVEVQA